MHKPLKTAAFLLQVALVCSTASAQAPSAKSGARATLLSRDRYIDSRLLLPNLTSDSTRQLANHLPTKLPVPKGESHRTRNMLIGGVIGSAVGIGVCTGISSLMNDSADGGLSTCTTKGNIAFAAGGFVAGALVGAAVR